jgi:thiamine kinase-like enzyme
LIPNEKKFSFNDLKTEAAALVALIHPLKGKVVKVRPLKGGLTNRNYRLDCEGERFVLRVMGDNSRLLGINRVAEHSCLRAAHSIGIGPEVVAFFPEKGALVTRFVTGRVLAPKALKSSAMLRRVVKSLRRYHEKSDGTGRFSAFETVRHYYALGRECKVSFPRNITQALGILDRIEAERGAPDRVCPCHNDLLPSNLVAERGKVWIIDWEYGGVGDLFFDLGNLAANNLFDDRQEIQLLEFYFGKARPDDLRRLRLMRRASDMREAMWGFLQMGISKLEFDYQTYARHHLERFLEGAARCPQFAVKTRAKE